VRDYARKCGFKQVVIGLSGGIDSALVAAIAAQALGAENVLGVLMPSPYSSEHSIADALELAKNLGISTQTLPIETAMQTFDRILSPMFAGTESGITEENLQSRIRGNLLMAIANKFGHLLLSTGNKSEMAVGYCTLYGDMNGGLAVISDLPKTRVYSLCQWLNAQLLNTQSQHPIIPENILTKAPSAELKPGQADQDSLPPYDVLDDILQRLISEHASPADIIQAGHKPEVVEKVVKLVTRAEFKRRQAAPGLKISDRAFGSGWRMPIASKRTVVLRESS
jgi:NAD+ synthase (glutamine-hydrolysing)